MSGLSVLIELRAEGKDATRVLGIKIGQALANLMAEGIEPRDVRLGVERDGGGLVAVLQVDGDGGGA